MKNLTGRLERIERLLPERCTETANPYTDEEKAAIAELLLEIHNAEYSNQTGRTTFKFPDGFVQFNNDEIFYDKTGELFPSLQAAQKKYKGIQVIPTDTGLAEKLFVALKGRI